MRRIAAMTILLAILVFACSSEVSTPKTTDPLEVMFYDYLKLIKEGNYKGAYDMFSADTKEFYPLEEYTEYAKSFILPKVNDVYVTKIEKRKLDATVFSEFKPKSSWATYNTMESAKVKLDFVYQNGRWWIHYTDKVNEGKEKKALEDARLARVNEWKPQVKFNEFKVENKITDEGPTLVFTGEVENLSDKPCEMIMVMVEFFNHKSEKVFQIILVPVYISKYEGKEGLKPKSKLKFESSILSEIPDSWTGKINYYIWDAGKMPAKQ